jgi:hypothetical protein
VGPVVGEPFGRRQRARRGLVLEDVIQDRDDVVAFRREHRFQIGELPPAMGQAVAADQAVVVVPPVGRQRVRHHDRRVPSGLAPRQQRAQVIARVRPARAVQTDDALAGLNHQPRGVHAPPLQRRAGRIGAPVLGQQRQNPHPGVVLKDHLALSRQIPRRLEYRPGTIGHPLGQLPLRRIGDRHPDQGLASLDPVKRQPQVVTAQGDHRLGAGAVFPGPGRRRRGEHLAASRAAQLLQLVAHRRQQGVAVDPNLDAGR